jgi:hypothetical protein
MCVAATYRQEPCWKVGVLEGCSFGFPSLHGGAQEAGRGRLLCDGDVSRISAWGSGRIGSGVVSEELLYHAWPHGILCACKLCGGPSVWVVVDSEPGRQWACEVCLAEALLVPEDWTKEGFGLSSTTLQGAGFGTFLAG